MFNREKSKSRARKRRKENQVKILELEKPVVVAGVGEIPDVPTQPAKREFVEWTDFQPHPTLPVVRIQGDMQDVSPGVEPWKQVWPLL